jgi:hypothetical protein
MEAALVDSNPDLVESSPHLVEANAEPQQSAGQRELTFAERWPESFDTWR